LGVFQSCRSEVLIAWSPDLLEHGDVEFRSWLVVQGALDGCPADTLAYEPFHRGIMGMGCALWRTPAALAVAG
jgi:hypothetical protein